jgi:hypothetical protein
MLASSRDRNSVAVNDKGVIVITVRSAQDRETVQKLRDEVGEAIQHLRIRGKGCLFLLMFRILHPVMSRVVRVKKGGHL